MPTPLSFASPSRLRAIAAPALLILAITCSTSADLQSDRRQHILTEGRAEFWRLRDVREVLTLDRVTDPRAAWARIELLAHQNTPPSLDQAETLLQQTISTLRRDADARAAALRDADAPPGQYNSSSVWPTEPLPFANDPHYWEFDLLPPDPRSIGLAGLWRFEPDPDDSGVKRGYARPDFNDRDWRTLYVPSKHGWERQGYPTNNIFVWYRKTLRIPAAWKDQPLRLHLGHNKDNPHWVAINGQFLKPLDADGSTSTYLDIPAKLLRTSDLNTIAIRLVNRAGPGGLLGPDLRLSVASSEAGFDRFPCGAGIARQATHRTPDLPTIVTYASALSPAAVVTTNQRVLHLAGWTARGYAPPRRCTFVSRGSLETIDLTETNSLDSRAFDENWLLLWDNRNAPETPRPLLLVFEKRPAAITLANDGFGGRAVQLRFPTPGARIAMIRPFAGIFTPQLTEEQVLRCRLWSRALIKYPIGLLEHSTALDGVVRLRTRYEYLDLADDWNTLPLPLAAIPAPNNNPAHTESPVTDLGCRPTVAYDPPKKPTNYFAAPDRSEITYTLPKQLLNAEP